jgi:hypothetical protein
MYLGLEILYFGKQNISILKTRARMWINVFCEFKNFQLYSVVCYRFNAEKVGNGSGIK